MGKLVLDCNNTAVHLVLYNDDHNKLAETRPTVGGTRPLLVSSDPLRSFSNSVFEVDESDSNPAAGPLRRKLDPRAVISTRTRNKTASATGVSRPAVNYGFDFPDDPAPAPTSTSGNRSVSPSETSPSARAPRNRSESIEEPSSLPSSLPSISENPSETSTSATPSPRPLLGSIPPVSGDSVNIDAVLSPAELDFRESVERFSHTDWAREQHNEPECTVMP